MGQCYMKRNTPEIDISHFTVDVLYAEDIPDLVPVIETWVRNGIKIVDGEVTGTIAQDEVHVIISDMRTSLTDESEKEYFVLRNESGKAVGMAGLVPIDERMLQFTETSKPVEMTSVFLGYELQRMGLGRKLVMDVLKNARVAGFTEVVWSSGPRYRWTAWGFYIKLFGKPVGVLEKYYDDEWDAQVWRVVV